MKMPDTAGGMVALALGVASLLGVAGGVATWTWERVQSIATKQYHDTQVSEALGPVSASLQNIEASAVVERIRGLLRSRCGGSFPAELQDILEDQLKRYQELAGREFRQGECRDGVWFSASGVPG